MPLTPEELAFAERLRALFARVDARHPERGVRTLLARARSAVAGGRALAEVLDELYQGALQRTERRLAAAARSACARERQG